MQFFPKANKFDLIERLLPVLAISLIIGAGCSIGWLLSAAKFRKEGKPLFKGPHIWTVILLAIFLFLSNLSFIYGQVLTFGFTEIFMLWVATLVFLYFSTVGEKKKSLLESYLPNGLLSLLTLNAIVGVYGFLTTDHLRFFGFFYNPMIKADAWPNAFALFFLLTFPFVLHALFYKKKDKPKKSYLKLLLTGFLIGTFLLSFSRAGLAAWIIEMIILAAVLFLTPKKKSKKKTPIKQVVVGLLILLIGTYGTFFSLQHLKSLTYQTTDTEKRFSQTFSGTSFNERAEFFQGSIELTEKSPLVGYGPSSFKWVYPQVQQGFLSISDHPHNLLLKYSVERGAPAAVFFLFFLLSLFLRANPFNRKTSVFKKVAWASLLGALAHSMVDHNLNFVTNYLIFWLLLTSVAFEIPKKKDTKTDFFSGFLSAILILALVLSSVLLIEQTNMYKRFLTQEKVTEREMQAFNPLLSRWWFLRLQDNFAEDSISSEILLKKEVQFNPYNHIAYIRLAGYSLQAKDYESAQKYFAEAITRNPKNTFKHYLGQIQTAVALGKTTDDLATKIRPLIEEYKLLYEQNLHYTQRTGEIENIKAIEDLIN